MKFNMCVLITLTIFLMSPILTDSIPDETTVSSELCLSHKLVNIDYLGIGYDIFLGNPRNNLYDPGVTFICPRYFDFSGCYGVEWNLTPANCMYAIFSIFYCPSMKIG